MYGIVGYGSNGRPNTVIQASMLWGLNSNENHLELSDKFSDLLLDLLIMSLPFMGDIVE